MDQHQVEIVEVPARHLVGMKVSSTMSKAPQDCPALWQAFGPRMAELQPAGCGCTGSYGVAVMTGAEDFDYWAAVEAKPSALPEGMTSVDLPAGAYAKCVVPSLEKLGEVYTHIYGAWPQSQTEYACNEQAPCFEWYPPNWQHADALEIYVPLRKV